MTGLRHLVPVLALLLPAAARAGLEVCNETAETAHVAIGYDDGGRWVSEGWWRVGPQGCVAVIDGDLTNQYYYWFAESDSRVWEDARYVFCTTSEAFTIRGDEDCGARGYDSTGFRELDLPDATSHVVTLRGIVDDGSLGAGDTAGQGRGDAGAQLTGGAGLLKDVVRPSVEVEMAPSGTYGDPFTLTGTFSHCDVLDEGMDCSFIEKDWIYVASSHNHTPSALLEDLHSRDANSRLLFSGDLASYDGSEANIVLRSFMNAGSDDFAAARAAMQGLWTSTDDPRFRVVIHGSLYEALDDGLPEARTYMSFRSSCAAGPGDGDAFRLLSADGLETRCFYLSRMEDTEMQLRQAGTGNIFRFRRAE